MGSGPQKAKKTSGEMEMEFPEALQSFYFDSKPIMPNEEFDNLKEELTWERSSVVTMNSDEQKFLEVSLSYAAGKPILSDQEFDELKLKLKQKGSKVAIAGSRCSLRNKAVSATSGLSQDDIAGFLGCSYSPRFCLLSG